MSKYGITRLIVCNKNNIFPISPQYLLHHIIISLIKRTANFNGIDSSLNYHSVNVLHTAGPRAILHRRGSAFATGRGD